MANKVTLPKEVAEAIESLRSLGKNNRWLVEAAEGETLGENSNKIRSYVSSSPKNFDVFLVAIVNGYEIEQSPEETLRKYYDDAKSNSRWAIDGSGHQIRYKERVEAVETTLRILGIQIEGVNA